MPQEHDVAYTEPLAVSEVGEIVELLRERYWGTIPRWRRALAVGRLDSMPRRGLKMLALGLLAALLIFVPVYLSIVHQEPLILVAALSGVALGIVLFIAYLNK